MGASKRGQRSRKNSMGKKKRTMYRRKYRGGMHLNDSYEYIYSKFTAISEKEEKTVFSWESLIQDVTSDQSMQQSLKDKIIPICNQLLTSSRNILTSTSTLIETYRSHSTRFLDRFPNPEEPEIIGGNSDYREKCEELMKNIEELNQMILTEIRLIGEDSEFYKLLPREEKEFIQRHLSYVIGVTENGLEICLKLMKVLPKSSDSSLSSEYLTKKEEYYNTYENILQELNNTKIDLANKEDVYQKKSTTENDKEKLRKNILSLNVSLSTTRTRLSKLMKDKIEKSIKTNPNPSPVPVNPNLSKIYLRQKFDSYLEFSNKNVSKSVSFLKNLTTDVNLIQNEITVSTDETKQKYLKEVLDLKQKQVSECTWIQRALTIVVVNLKEMESSLLPQSGKGGRPNKSTMHRRKYVGGDGFDDKLENNTENEFKTMGDMIKDITRFHEEMSTEKIYITNLSDVNENDKNEYLDYLVEQIGIINKIIERCNKLRESIRSFRQQNLVA